MKKRTTKLLALLLAATLLLCSFSLPANAAVDDIENHWGRNAINYCITNGYMSGVSGTKFQPNGPVTRAQVVQVLYSMAGSPDTSNLSNPFTDSQKHWAKKAITWSRAAGIASGTSATTFSPNAKVTRAQVTVMFMGYANQDKSNTYVDDLSAGLSALRPFHDFDQIPSWAMNGMRWAVQYGLMKGSNNKLRPNGTLTRAELATIIKNYFELQPVVEPDPSASPKPTSTPNPSPTSTPTPQPTATPTPTPSPSPAPTPEQKPYIASTIVRAELNNPIYGPMFGKMILDGNENIVYQDLNRRKIFRISHGEGGWGKPEELLDQAQAKCTVAIDGKSYTYSNSDFL